MVGHSKGGHEATWNAIKTGRSCITFNTMAMTIFSKDFMSLSTWMELISYQGKLDSGEVTMTHYVVRGEALNVIFGEQKIGTTVYLPTQHSSPWWDIRGTVSSLTNNHFMSAVIAALKQEARTSTMTSSGGKF